LPGTYTMQPKAMQHGSINRRQQEVSWRLGFAVKQIDGAGTYGPSTH
jgi:hypothetical protein